MKQQKILILLLAGIILAGGAIAFLLKDNTPKTLLHFIATGFQRI